MVILKPFEKEVLENYWGWVIDEEVARLVDRALPVTDGRYQGIFLMAIPRKDLNIGFRA